MRYAVNASHAGGGLLNVMTTTLTTIMMSTLVLLLIIMLITATLHNATKMPYRASAAQIPMIVTVSNLLNVLTVPLSNAAVRWYLLCLHCILHIPPHTYWGAVVGQPELLQPPALSPQTHPRCIADSNHAEVKVSEPSILHHPPSSSASSVAGNKICKQLQLA